MTKGQWDIIFNTLEKFDSLVDGFRLIEEEDKAKNAKRSVEILESCITELLEEEKKEPIQVGDYVEWNSDNEGPYLIAKSAKFWGLGEGPFLVTGMYKFPDQNGLDKRGTCLTFSPVAEMLSLKSSTFFKKVTTKI